MQKFRDYIYCDENRLNSYISQIKELKQVEVTKNSTRTSSIEAKANIMVANGGSHIEDKSSTDYEIKSSNLERMIEWANKSKNSIVYNKQKLNCSDEDSLIFFEGKINIPEMSSNFELLNSVAKNTELFNMVPISDEDRNIIKYIKECDIIPVIIDNNSDYLFNLNIRKNNLIISTDDFFDYVDDKVKVIGKIEKVYNSENEIEIFDLTKEVFKLNRSIRRQISKDDIKDSIICENGPLVKVVPIIIYK